MQIRNFVLALVATANVAAQYHLDLCTSNVTVKGTAFPKLIEATLEELQVGLESGLFTVRLLIVFNHHNMLANTP